MKKYAYIFKKENAEDYWVYASSKNWAIQKYCRDHNMDEYPKHSVKVYELPEGVHIDRKNF